MQQERGRLAVGDGLGLPHAVMQSAAASIWGQEAGKDILWQSTPRAPLLNRTHACFASRTANSRQDATHLKALVARLCMTSVKPRPWRILLARAPALSAPISWRQQEDKTASALPAVVAAVHVTVPQRQGR